MKKTALRASPLSDHSLRRLRYRTGTYNDHALVHSIACPYWSWEDTSTLLEKIAFTFLDLDGDGADELLLGWHDTDSYDMQDGYAFAVYRLADDVPTFALRAGSVTVIRFALTIPFI